MISLEDFFTTNRAPNDEEHKILKHLAAEYDDRLTTITNKISDLEAQLQILNDEKTLIMEAAAPFKRALLPFRRLPEDVVREIFVACLPIGRDPTMSATEAPVLLTRISSATRRVALTTPALWAAIHIRIEILPERMDDATSIMAARAVGVEEWLLRRSGSLPLHISVHHPRAPYKDHDLGQKIIDILLGCCSRWRCVSFMSLPKFLLRISTLTHADVPILNSLSICPSRSDRDDVDWKSSLILTAPNLQRLSVSGMPRPSDYLANWSNLTHIGFPRTFHFSLPGFIEDLARILRQTTRLISCCIRILGNIGLLNPVDEISLPFLKVLDVIEDGILPAINAPALETIRYNAYDDIDAAPMNLIALLKRTPNVKELWMGDFTNPHFLVECLRHCPSLTRLRVSGLIGSDDNDKQNFIRNDALIEAFVLDDDTQCLCPRLEYFHCDKYFPLSLGTLHKFITHKNGRSQALSRWDTVVIKVVYHPRDEHLQYIGELSSKYVVEDMKLSLLFEKWARSYNSFGMRKPEAPEDVWWQRRSQVDFEHLMY
ncbi:hypothetical protein HYPSUDRAFT_45255 [Hypholoma sublateritium FD-334 SS-4]|uniref:F-box domain-containing protein n=1 Tax=Hypholoma sublateritium (strain FD-334 SS-4) TaxID=945553 RepID=A0A0D2NHF8_HYPSF|nr:hypothetical protein HYPSUDRAFT_45255 [Hypholoma sublateritium FD-334 SS-4]